jgi:hypothetical protein
MNAVGDGVGGSDIVDVVREGRAAAMSREGLWLQGER